MKVDPRVTVVDAGVRNVLETITERNLAKIEGCSDMARELNWTTEILSGDLTLKQPGRAEPALKLPTIIHYTDDGIHTNSQPSTTP